MPLALQLLTRPARVAGLVLLAGLVALLAAALALGAHTLAPPMAPAVLVATALVAGALAPLYGRGAAVGLWTARAAMAVGAVALVLPDTRPTIALRVIAALAALAGLRLVARGVGRAGDLPAWSAVVVGVAVAATLLAPGLGGAAVLGIAWLAVAAAIRVTYLAPAAVAPQRA